MAATIREVAAWVCFLLAMALIASVMPWQVGIAAGLLAGWLNLWRWED